MHLYRKITSCAGLLLAAGAFAQSLNVDINVVAGGGAGVPQITFAGGAGQTGSWNAIPAGGPANTTYSLVGLNGSAVAATLKRVVGGSAASVILPTSGETAKLLNDIEVTGNGAPDSVWEFGGLTAGTYAFYTYAVDPQQLSRATAVFLTGNAATIQFVDGNPSANWLIPTRTYALHVVTVSAGQTVSLSVRAGSLAGQGGLAGFQVRKLNPGERLRWIVDKANTGATITDGLSWGSAMFDLQDALAGAQGAGGSNLEIWVKRGIYTPTSGTDRTISFPIASSLKLYGGFFGTEATLADRVNPRQFITYLSGGIGGATNTDNSYNVVDASNTSFSTLVDGFFITSGYSNQVNGNDGKGGGVKMVNGTAVFRGCNIINNTATFAGAGVYSQGGAPTFLDCIFYNNHNNNGEGGAVYHTGGLIDFWNCRFLGNSSTGPGAGIELINSSARVVNCDFSGNGTGFGGGGLYVTGVNGDAFVLNSTFSNNTSSTVAGGIQCRSGANLTLRNSIVWGNQDSFSIAPETRNVSIEGLGSGTTYSMSYSTIEGLSAYSGVGCNALNPQFVNAAGPDNNPGNFDDDLRLKSISPLINSGSVSNLVQDIFDINSNGLTTTEQLPIDLAGNARRIAAASAPPTGVGPAPFVDRGAYEYLPPCPGDTNGDGVVNFLDLNNVLSNFGQSGFGLPGDVNADGVVNFLDLNIVLSNFGTIC